MKTFSVIFLRTNNSIFLNLTIAPEKELHFCVLLGYVLYSLLLLGCKSCLAQKTVRKCLKIMLMKR